MEKFTRQEKDILTSLVLDSMKESSDFKFKIFADTKKVDKYQEQLKNILDKLLK